MPKIGAFIQITAFDCEWHGVLRLHMLTFYDELSALEQRGNNVGTYPAYFLKVVHMKAVKCRPADQMEIFSNNIAKKSVSELHNMNGIGIQN